MLVYYETSRIEICRLHSNLEYAAKTYYLLHSYKPGKERYKSMRDMDTIKKATIEGIRKFSSKSFVACFELPQGLITSNSIYTRVVQISYCLQVIVSGHKLRFPIMIRLVPLNNNNSIATQVMPSSSSEVQKLDSDDPGPSAPPPSALNFVLPRTSFGSVESRKLLTNCLRMKFDSVLF
jgi:hypothetical protein